MSASFPKKILGQTFDFVTADEYAGYLAFRKKEFSYGEKGGSTRFRESALDSAVKARKSYESDYKKTNEDFNGQIPKGVADLLDQLKIQVEEKAALSRVASLKEGQKLLTCPPDALAQQKTLYMDRTGNSSENGHKKIGAAVFAVTALTACYFAPVVGLAIPATLTGLGIVAAATAAAGSLGYLFSNVGNRTNGIFSKIAGAGVATVGALGMLGTAPGLAGLVGGAAIGWGIGMTTDFLLPKFADACHKNFGWFPGNFSSDKAKIARNDSLARNYAFPSNTTGHDLQQVERLIYRQFKESQKTDLADAAAKETAKNALTPQPPSTPTEQITSSSPKDTSPAPITAPITALLTKAENSIDSLSKSQLKAYSNAKTLIGNFTQTAADSLPESEQGSFLALSIDAQFNLLKTTKPSLYISLNAAEIEPAIFSLLTAILYPPKKKPPPLTENEKNAKLARAAEFLPESLFKKVSRPEDTPKKQPEGIPSFEQGKTSSEPDKNYNRWKTLNLR